MLSRPALVKLLGSAGWPQAELPSSAAAYLLFRLGALAAYPSRTVTALTPRGSYEAVSCTMRELHLCQPA
jgi:hypothetical protein